MMNRYFKNIFVTVLSLNLFLASVGLPVYKHYCKGSLVGFQYLVAQENFCHPDHEEAACCSSDHHADHQEKECSKDASQDRCCSDAKDCGNCCKDELELVKVDLLSFLQSERGLQTNLVTFNLSFVHPLADFTLHLADFVCTPERIQTRSGPLPDGQSRVISFQKFIC